MGEKRGGKVRWGWWLGGLGWLEGGREYGMVSGFETDAGWKKEEWARRCWDAWSGYWTG